MAEVIPALPDAVKPVVASTIPEETNKSAEKSNISEAQQDASGKEPDTATEQEPQKDAQPQEEKKEPTPGELARKERNRQRWQQMKSERQEALQRAAWAEAELARIRNSRPDLSQVEDPDEALALKTAYRVREMTAGDHEARAQQERHKADQAMYEAWNTIKEDMREKAPDFDQVVNEQTPIHKLAAPFLVESDKGGELAYWLGKNPQQARDLYNKFETAPAQALIELGRIEARLSTSSSKSPTKAPKPVPTLSATASPPGFDVTTGSVQDFAAELKKAGIIR